MSELTAFHFIRPWCLVSVAIAIVVWWFYQRASDPFHQWQKVITPDLLDAVTVNQDPTRQWRSIALLMFWCLAAIAIAGPTWRPEPSPFADDPVPVMLLLKSGESMNESDLSPNRMERARLKVVDFANARKGQPLGLIAYAGSAHLVLPPTRDTGVVATMASEISPEIMPTPGDRLGSALQLAAKTLGDGGGSIVVVTDTIPTGENSQYESFVSENRASIEILGIAREGTPESNDLSKAASALRADVTLITADSTDVEGIVRRVADTPIAVSVDGEGTRWAEMGWWLVPVIAVGMLTVFRREEQQQEQTT
ncbi:vWA domain-containing protein [Rhodopirellula sallentina]|uniref:vWA domain-containing protein n=1 Tax=Rhodopirellula sallentina TaxID=1263869 RepID=UPI0005C7BB35|nr:VWA domain-containing protein [Rhodopirellula sallentina]